MEVVIIFSLTFFLFGIFLLLVCSIFFLSGIQIYNSIRIHQYTSKILFTPNKRCPRVHQLDSFTIANPYDCPGEFRKAQLHLHTSNSKDVSEKIPVHETILKYKDAGYHFVVITDHDIVTTYSDLNSSDFICLPGMELTIPFLFWPLGKHLVVINPHREFPSASSGKISLGKFNSAKLAENSFILPAHPNWRGNLGTGFWYLNDFRAIPGCQLLEIFNVHSDSSWDLSLWHNLLKVQGYQKPIWGVAVDDTDNGKALNKGWIMVKTETISEEALLKALKNGNFYATTGPSADFQVSNGIIEVRTDRQCQIQFINQQNSTVVSIF